METHDIERRISHELGFTPTEEQRETIRTFVSFMCDRSAQALMMICGSAGTGKTSVVAAIVRAMRRLNQRVVLLAPTGRAAKVLAMMSDSKAHTIHRRIYRQKVFGGAFSLAPNLTPDTLFVVDEASMIANSGLRDTVFGNGLLLDDLVKYVYGGHNCRLLLVGDDAQLPPIGEDVSPALDVSFMEGYGLTVYESALREVLRQQQQSGILFNATVVRQMIDRNDVSKLPKVRFSGFADIVLVRGDELIDTLATSYSDVGMDETIVVTRSNKRANIYNQGIRNTILDREELLSTGDIIMIVKNNYYWSEKEKAAEEALKNASATAKTPKMQLDTYTTADSLDFLANGDRAVVQRVRNVRELYGFTFADITIQLLDHDNYEMTVTAILDSLTAEAPALSNEQAQRLYEGVLADYAELRTKSEKIESVRSDPYFNALQIKFAYAVTCHKAQGGQWCNVFVDQGYMTDEMLSADYLHWLYTAFTRATERLYLVNWSPKQTEEPT